MSVEYSEMQNGDGKTSTMSHEERDCLADLEKILQAEDKWIKLEDLDMSPGCPPGENFVADVVRTVAYGKRLCSGVWTDFRKSFILKKIPGRESFRHKYHDCRRLLENEIAAYEIVLPFCLNYLKEKLPGETDGEPCFPRYYGQCQTFLVLEDLQAKGYQMANRVKGFGKKECSVILQELSKFHAASFALKKNEKLTFSDVANSLRETLFRREYKTDLMEAIWENSLTFAVRSLRESNDPQLLKASKKLESHSGKVWAILCDLVEPNTDKFNVICHGDLWNNNILLRYCDSGYPIAVKFIDLQIMRHGSCVLDVMHFLFTSSRSCVHEKHLDSLLGEYYDSLSSNLKNLGDLLDFTYDEFREEFRSRIFFGVFMACLLFLYLTRVSGPAETAEEDSESGETLASSSYLENMYGSLTEKYHEKLRSLFATLANLNLI